MASARRQRAKLERKRLLWIQSTLAGVHLEIASRDTDGQPRCYAGRNDIEKSPHSDLVDEITSAGLWLPSRMTVLYADPVFFMYQDRVFDKGFALLGPRELALVQVSEYLRGMDDEDSHYLLERFEDNVAEIADKYRQDFPGRVKIGVYDPGTQDSIDRVLAK